MSSNVNMNQQLPDFSLAEKSPSDNPIHFDLQQEHDVDMNVENEIVNFFSPYDENPNQESKSEPQLNLLSSNSTATQKNAENKNILEIELDESSSPSSNARQLKENSPAITSNENNINIKNKWRNSE